MCVYTSSRVEYICDCYKGKSWTLFDLYPGWSSPFYLSSLSRPGALRAYFISFTSYRLTMSLLVIYFLSKPIFKIRNSASGMQLTTIWIILAAAATVTAAPIYRGNFYNAQEGQYGVMNSYNHSPLSISSFPGRVERVYAGTHKKRANTPPPRPPTPPRRATSPPPRASTPRPAPPPRRGSTPPPAPPVQQAVTVIRAPVPVRPIQNVVTNLQAQVAAHGNTPSPPPSPGPITPPPNGPSPPVHIVRPQTSPHHWWVATTCERHYWKGTWISDSNRVRFQEHVLDYLRIFLYLLIDSYELISPLSI